MFRRRDTAAPGPRDFVPYPEHVLEALPIEPRVLRQPPRRTDRGLDRTDRDRGVDVQALLKNGGRFRSVTRDYEGWRW